MENTRTIYTFTTRKELADFVKSNKYVIVKTSATWCGPCKTVKPHVNKWLELLPESIKIVFIDADKGVDILRALKWHSLPTIGNFIDGYPMDIVVGANIEAYNGFFRKTIARTKEE